MKTYISNIKYIVIGALVFLTSCVSDDLADVGDLPDFTGPTPFYSFSDISTSSFDCNEVELSANYEYKFEAGSNLAVNGTQYEWTITPSDGVLLINKDLPILKQLIDAQLATVVALEDEIAKLEFKIPCETDQAKKDVFESEITALRVKLEEERKAISNEMLEAVKELEAQIATLPPATLQDRELIISFPAPGEYTVALTVTDNLGKSASTEKKITVNQAVPTIPVPEIGEPSFEDNSLFDGTGDGRDSWRVPDNTAWSPKGSGTTVVQINTDTNPDPPNLPDGIQAAKFPSDGSRVAYQEIEVTPGATYVITYFTDFKDDSSGELKVSILTPTTSSYAEAQLEANIIASRTDNNTGRVYRVFKKHAITFDAGDNESVIIFATNSGVESRLDAFGITVKQ